MLGFCSFKKMTMDELKLTEPVGLYWTDMKSMEGVHPPGRVFSLAPLCKAHLLHKRQTDNAVRKRWKLPAKELSWCVAPSTCSLYSVNLWMPHFVSLFSSKPEWRSTAFVLSIEEDRINELLYLINCTDSNKLRFLNQCGKLFWLSEKERTSFSFFLKKGGMHLLQISCKGKEKKKCRQHTRAHVVTKNHRSFA